MLPELHRDDLHEALREMYEAGREHHLFAFYGTGTPEELTTDFAGRVSIRPVASELELRMALPALDDESRVAFLVPWRGEVPMDLRGRFARNGTVRAIGKEQRIRRVFKVDQLDEDVLASPLVAYLLSPQAPQSLPCRKSILTLDDMWAAWLTHEWGAVAEDDFALDRLLVWAATDARGPSWKAQILAAGGQEVLVALARHLTRKRGDAAQVVLSAWLAGRGSKPLEYGLVCEPLLRVEQGRFWITMQLTQEQLVSDERQALKVAGQLVDAVPTAMSELWRQAPNTARLVLERADSLVTLSDIRARLVDSPFLPSAWRMRLDELGRALTHAANAPSAQGFTAALARLALIEKHELFKEESMHRVAERAEMAVRLLAWLCSDQSDLDPSPVDSPYADLERLARWYASEGGFVDWARHVARGAAQTPFDQGVQAVVAQADERRRALDARFAASLPKWLQAKRPSKQVVPIEDVSKRVVAKFLEEHQERSLLVLLLDGMAWPQAIEIVLSLQDHPEQWGPIAWHGERNGLGDGPYPAVMAALPTVTEISRSAFFAGKLMQSGRDHGTEKDPDRWKDNSNIAKFVPAGDFPRLLLRGEGHEAHGVASNEAISQIADRTRRVVGLVINAIDAALKGDPQQWHPWRYENVRSLAAILSAAREAGRTVLLASDHGHVRCDLMRSSAGPVTGGARYRPLTNRNEPVADFEVELFGEGVWAPKGAYGVALLTDEVHRYGGGAHAGEHGGATLAEVVAPCMLVRWEDQLSASTDPSLAVRTLLTPTWWYRELRVATAQVAAPKARKAAPAATDSKQLGLLDVAPLPVSVEPAPPTAATSAQPPAPSPAMLALAAVPGIAELPREARERLLRALAFLLERNGLAKLDAFAGHLGIPTFRARGLVANQLSPVLNVDGYQVVSCDETHVRLDRGMLAQQLEVDL